MPRKKKSPPPSKPDKQHAQPKSSFRLSKALKARLPASEQASAEQTLWAKSSGLCALCGTALGKDIDPDHIVPTSEGGSDIVANIYLAHKSCNASRQALPFDLAKAVVGFKVFAEQKAAVTFDDVLAKYVKSGNRDVTLKIQNATATLNFGTHSYEATVAQDPATGVRYFFAEVPVTHILNDREIQPRLIMHSHVRKLLLDFAQRPVHEPSNCRLCPTAGETASLLQFDGQHKTTAQILLGRDHVPVKVYIDPPIPMLQELVIKIQQEIKKQPLTRSDTLAKLGDVMQAILADYKPPKGQVRTERGLVESQKSRADQSEVKKVYFADLERLVFFDEENDLGKQVRPGKTSPPTTDKVVIDRVIRPFIYSGLLDVDMDTSQARDNERESILLVLKTVARKMLPPGWRTNELQRLRAQNFFYQAAIGWWMEILTLSIRYALHRLGEKKPLFHEPLHKEQETAIIALCEQLCSWPVWSTQDSEDLKALRSNTVKNVAHRPVFAEYDDRRLCREALK